MKKTLILITLVLSTLTGYAKPNFEIPEIKKYESAEDCRKDNDIALKTAQYYLSAQLPEEAYWTLSAAQYIMTWIEASDDITVYIDKKRGLYLKCESTDIASQLAVAYLAGCTIYCLENKQKEHDFNMHYFAVSKMMTYYEKNREKTGRDKIMDGYLKDFKKGKLKAKEEKKFKTKD
ncbi:MAG: hypothetical protein J6Y37_01425 [Paludibacteraceae bacterium]|nr:hypothetical protein [Paludibacteraceae bacterium]